MPPRGWRKNPEAQPIDPEIVEPSDIEASDGPDIEEGSARAPRKRRKTKVNADGLEAILLSVHLTLAGLTKTPELALTEPEAKQLAVCSANVARHYEIPGLSEVAMDWTYLIVAIVLTYQPRMKAIGRRKKDEAAAAENGEVTGSNSSNDN